MRSLLISMLVAISFASPLHAKHGSPFNSFDLRVMNADVIVIGEVLELRERGELKDDLPYAVVKIESRIRCRPEVETIFVVNAGMREGCPRYSRLVLGDRRFFTLHHEGNNLFTTVGNEAGAMKVPREHEEAVADFAKRFLAINGLDDPADFRRKRLDILLDEFAFPPLRHDAISAIARSHELLTEMTADQEKRILADLAADLRTSRKLDTRFEILEKRKSNAIGPFLCDFLLKAKPETADSYAVLMRLESLADADLGVKSTHDGDSWVRLKAYERRAFLEKVVRSYRSHEKVAKKIE